MMRIMAEQPLRVMVVDDHEVVRQGLRMLLESQDDLAVVAEADTTQAAITAADRHHPDVIVMDVALNEGSGIEATRAIRARQPRVRVLMLTGSDDREALFSSIMAGASGYILKGARGDELVTAVRTVGQGRNLIDPALTGVLLERIRAGGDPLQENRLTRLSGQETRILALVADGLTNADIGARLDLAEKTVRNYVSSILRKLEVTRRAQAAAYLARRTAVQRDR